MNKNIGRHIFWIVIGGMICFISACNNDSVSEKQAESFLKYYVAGNVGNTGTEVIQTSDGYAIMGNFENVSTQKNIFIVFTDEFGRQKTGNPIEIGTDTLNDHGYSMIRLGDGYLISGTSFNTTQKWGYLVNISSEGTVLWEKRYSGYQELEFRNAAIAPSDGNIIITGYSINNPGDDMEAIIFKTNTDGDSLWCKSYLMRDRNDVGEAIIEYQKRYHVITTSTVVGDKSLSRIRMLNTNTKGGAPTSYEIKKDYYSGKDLVETAGNMYILGNIQDPAARESSIFLAELELTWGGAITSLKDSATISNLESIHAESFAPVEQNRLAIGGWQIKPSDKDILFLLVDLVNNKFGVEMIKPYGSNKGSQTSQDIIYTGDDRGFALTGSVDLAGGRTSMLLKIDSDGELR